MAYQAQTPGYNPKPQEAPDTTQVGDSGHLNTPWNMGETIVSHPQGAAIYGQNELGQSVGATQYRDEQWAQRENNDAAQQQSSAGQQWANGQMAGSASRVGATENRGLANNEADSRYGYQNNSIGLAGSMARGNSPSASAYQLQSGLDQGMAQQASMSRSGRGAASLATGQANAMGNTAAMQQNAFSQGQQLRATEMAAGRGLYGSLTTQQRAQDQARLQQGNDMANYNAQANSQYGLGMAGLANQFGELGNAQQQTDFGYLQQGMAPIYDQSNAVQQQQGWLADAKSTANKQNAEEQDGGMLGGIV